MSSTNSAEGIIYKISDSSTADKIVSIIDTHGKKVSFAAKGVKKAGSKRSHALELGNLVKIKFVDGYNLNILTDIQVMNEFLHWKKEFAKMLFLQMFCEIIGIFCFEENHDEHLFNLFLESLTTNSEKTTYIASVFILKILNLTGHLPDLERDVYTDDKLTSQTAFLDREIVGYVVKDASNSYAAEEYKVSDRIYKTQRFILQSNLSQGLRVSLTPEEEKKMLTIHLNWLEQSIDKPLKSWQVVRGVV